jgi:hypothetical protein
MCLRVSRRTRRARSVTYCRTAGNARGSSPGGYGRATHIAVSLELGPAHVELEVRDNGTGISGEANLSRLASEGHFGLIGMHERAELIGGSLSLSSDGEGVTVRCRAPRSSASTESIRWPNNYNHLRRLRKIATALKPRNTKQSNEHSVHHLGSGRR